MNPQKTTIAILAMLSAVSLALADNFKTVNGKEYKDATVTRVEADGIVVKSKSGITKLYFVELPKEVQARFGHDAGKIEGERVAAGLLDHEAVRRVCVADAALVANEVAVADLPERAVAFRAGEP